MIRATQSQVAQFILQKAGLLADASSTETLVERLVGLPMVTPMSTVLALQVRHPHQTRDDGWLTLRQNPHLIRRPGRRSLPFLVSTGQVARLQSAVGRQLRQHFNSQFLHWQVEQASIVQLAETILAHFGDEPLTVEQITARLDPGQLCDLNHTSRGGRQSTTTNVALAVGWLEAQGQLVARPVADAVRWHQFDFAYALPEIWYLDLDFAESVPEAEAQVWLTRAYLAAFGPVTEADISAWTGFGKSETSRAASALTAETTLTMVDGIPGAMLMLKAQADVLKAIEPMETPSVHILPADDPFVTAFKASRSRLLISPKTQRQIFNSTDQAQPTILVDGKIVGLWQWQLEAEVGQIRWRLLSEVEADLAAKIEAELAKVGQFMGIDDIVMDKPA